MSKKTKTVDLALTEYELVYLYELLEAELDDWDWDNRSEYGKNDNRQLRRKIKNAQKKYGKIHYSTPKTK